MNIPLIFAQFYDELFKLFARQRTYIGFGAFAVVQIIAAILLQRPEVENLISNLLNRNGLDTSAYFSGITLAMLINFLSINPLGGLYIALIAGDIVAKEHEEGTLRLVLARPISRVRLVVLKWLSCMVYTAALVLFLAITALITGILLRGGLGGLTFLNPTEEVFYFVPPERALGAYFQTCLGMGFSGCLLASAAFMFSCFKMKPAAASVLALTLFFIDFVLFQMPFFRPFKEYFFQYHVSFYLRLMSDHPSWLEAWMSILYISAVNLTCLLIGILRFSTRDLKG